MQSTTLLGTDCASGCCPSACSRTAGSLLSPSPDAAVVGGNVLTSQRVTDVVLKAFNAAAASQVRHAADPGMHVCPAVRPDAAACRLLGARFWRWSAANPIVLQLFRPSLPAPVCRAA